VLIKTRYTYFAKKPLSQKNSHLDAATQESLNYISGLRRPP